MVAITHSNSQAESKEDKKTTLEIPHPAFIDELDEVSAMNTTLRTAHTFEQFYALSALAQDFGRQQHNLVSTVG